MGGSQATATLTITFSRECFVTFVMFMCHIGITSLRQSYRFILAVILFSLCFPARILCTVCLQR